MPRAIDPPGRFPRIDWDPTTKGLFLDPASMPRIDPVELAAGLFQNLIEGVRDRIIQMIYEATGINLAEIMDYIGGALGLTGEGGLLTLINAWKQMLGDMDWSTATPQQVISGFVGFVQSGLEIVGDVVGEAVARIVALLTGKHNGTELDLAKWRDGLLSMFSPLNAANLIGLIRPWNLSKISASAVTAESENLLINPEFDSEGAVAGEGIWFYDPDVGYQVPGSVTTTCDGTLKELRSNRVFVAVGQAFDPAIRVRWQGLQGTGTLAAVGVEAYAGGVLVGYEQFGAVTGELPGDSTGITAGSPGNQGDWLRLWAETYQVPAGVDEICLRLSVTANATAGRVWFDDGELYLSEETGWLPTRLKDLRDRIGAVIDRLWQAFTALPGVGKTIEELGDAAADALHTIRDFIHNIVDGLFAAFSGLGGGVGKTVQELLDAVGGAWANVADALSGKITIGDLIPDVSIPGLGQLRDVIKNAIDGLSNLFGWGINDVEEAMRRQSELLAAQAAVLAELQANVAANNFHGVVASAKFDYLRPAGLEPADWEVGFLEGAAGQYAVNGKEAIWYTSGSGARWQVNRWVGENQRSLTNFQRVVVVLSSKMVGSGFLEGDVYISVLGRIADTNLSTFTEARFYRDHIVIYAWNNGAATQIGGTAPLLSVPGVGSALILECGTAGGERVLRGGMNNIQHTVIDPGHGQVGEAFRGWGWGARAANRADILGGQVPAPNAVQWAAADNTPISVTVPMLRVYRSANMTVQNYAPLPNNFFDVVDFGSPAMIAGWDATAGRFTAPEAGLYLLSLRLTYPPPTGGNPNPGQYQPWGQEVTIVQSTSNTVTEQFVNGAAIPKYLTAGQSIRFGCGIFGVYAVDSNASMMRWGGLCQGTSSYAMISKIA